MNPIYYCPICGHQNCRFLGAVCFTCRQLVSLQRTQNERPPPGPCFYCGEIFNILTTDHVVPIIRGGPDTEWNKVASCPTCNAQKSDSLPSEWCPKHEAALRIQKNVSEIIPRMRHGRVISEHGVTYTRILASCAGFAAALLECTNSLPLSNSVGRQTNALRKQAMKLRTHLIDHPEVVRVRQPLEESRSDL